MFHIKGINVWRDDENPRWKWILWDGAWPVFAIRLKGGEGEKPANRSKRTIDTGSYGWKRSDNAFMTDIEAAVVTLRKD